MRAAVPTPSMLRSSSLIRSLVLGLAVLLLAAGCDSASPVAPEGTVLTINANPDRISADGTSQIRVTARRANGTPVNPGTEIRLSTTLGEIAATVAIDERGEATTALRGTGQQGTAKVKATTGSSEEVSVEVRIGLQVSDISLQASPAAVPETGGSLELVALVRDDQGQALQGANVNFRTDVGRLQSGGSLVTTDASGAARDRLSVSSGDLGTVTGDTFKPAAEVGTPSGNKRAEVTVTIQRLPRVSFTATRQPLSLTIVFRDTSTGNPTSWLWSFGDGNTSQEQNPVHAYAAAGAYVVTLEATNSLGTRSTSQLVTVSSSG